MNSTLENVDPDHVAVAVPDPELAAGRWHERLGGGLLTKYGNGIFAGRQYRYANGAKVELLSPHPDDPSKGNFVRRFLAGFGTRIHHVTLKVDDIHAAIDTVQRAGLDVVDARTDGSRWREAFLRPSQVGGLVVQLAWAAYTDEEWAERRGAPPQQPRADAACFEGVRLRHPDLDTARTVWEVLGAKVDERGDGIRCRWDANPIEVHVDAGDPAGPVALRFSNAPALPQEDGVGPPLEIVDAP